MFAVIVNSWIIILFSVINNNVVRGIGVPNYSITNQELQQMYLDNKYTNLYYNIINTATSRKLLTRATAKKSLGYVEQHHILPKALGGTNEKQNLVFLTAKEHFVCHRLLVKMTNGINKRKMISALQKMTLSNKFQNRIRITGRLYENIRKMCAEFKGELHHNYGKTRTAAWRATRSKQYTGENNPNFGKRYKITDTTNYNNSGDNNPMFNKKHSEKTIALLKHRAKNRIKKECPQCGHVFDISNYTRWHGDKCNIRL